MSSWGKLEAASRTGTISIANNTGTVTGVGTSFLTQVRPGDVIISATQRFEVVAIASNTSMTVTPNASPAITGQAYTVTQLPKSLPRADKLAGVELVTTSEAQAKTDGKVTPGWTRYKTYTAGPGGSITRRVIEPLVVFKS